MLAAHRLIFACGCQIVASELEEELALEDPEIRIGLSILALFTTFVPVPIRL